MEAVVPVVIRNTRGFFGRVRCAFPNILSVDRSARGKRKRVKDLSKNTKNDLHRKTKDELNNKRVR
jgi:hypothetical protein